MKECRNRHRTATSVFAAILIATCSVGSPGAAATLHRIGSVTWHAKRYKDTVLDLVGYPLARRDGYVLFSDEAHGKISAHDLPVTGTGIDRVKLHHRYRIRGKFILGGLKASNGNPYHLQSTSTPLPAPR